MLVFLCVTNYTYMQHEVEHVVPQVQQLPLMVIHERSVSNTPYYCAPFPPFGWLMGCRHNCTIDSHTFESCSAVSTQGSQFPDFLYTGSPTPHCQPPRPFSQVKYNVTTKMALDHELPTLLLTFKLCPSFSNGSGEVGL